jgi:outer membrane biosynthesis protein TonB
VNRNAAFGVGALLGAAAALVWDRRRRLGPAPAASAPETRQRELREKLAGTQQPEAASPAPEPPAAPPPEPPAAPPPEPPAAPPPEPPPAPPPPQPEAKPPPPPPPPGPPPADEFEAMRRRIHEEGKAAAEDMRREPDEAS